VIFRDGAWMIDYFEKSVSMSTYLVAYVISDFKSVKKVSDKHRIEVEVAARPEPIMNGDGNFALDHAAKIIDFFTDYFDVKYPLKKSSKKTFEKSACILYKSKFLFLIVSSNRNTRFQ
jgi:aminopeptidase N